MPKSAIFSHIEYSKYGETQFRDVLPYSENRIYMGSILSVWIVPHIAKFCETFNLWKKQPLKYLPNQSFIADEEIMGGKGVQCLDPMPI